MTSMTNGLNLFLWLFSYFWLLLNSYHIIQTLIAPIGLTNTFSGSQLSFSEKSLFVKWLRHFLLALFCWIFDFCHFCFFSIVIRLFVMLFWITMHVKNLFPLIGVYWSVLNDFRWKLLILMAVKPFKKIIRKLFKH